MYLQHLYLRNFRNYEEARISFGPRINAIQGHNAQGKTNLLEAIYFLSTGKSFRTVYLTDLIRQTQSYFYIEAEIIRDNLSQTLKVYFDGKQKKIHVNNTCYQNFTNLLGLVPAVLFAPENISLITGTPSERRRFLNLHLAQTDPLYVHHLLRYSHAMRQRNQLLKQKSEVAIEIWEEIMAISASYLVIKRKKAVSDLVFPLKAYMQTLSSGEEDLSFHYDPKEELAPLFRNQFQKHRTREMQVGSTLTGPHRDDFSIFIGGKEAKHYASEGQKRTGIAAVHLAEWERLKQITGVNPLLCIDDFGVHLDPSRHHLFLQQLHNLQQVFLTSPCDIPLASHKLHIEKGKQKISNSR